jgi:hypothetical protein
VAGGGRRAHFAKKLLWAGCLKFFVSGLVA